MRSVYGQTLFARGASAFFILPALKRIFTQVEYRRVYSHHENMFRLGSIKNSSRA